MAVLVSLGEFSSIKGENFLGYPLDFLASPELVPKFHGHLALGKKESFLHF